jgi:hypothetical protein
MKEKIFNVLKSTLSPFKAQAATWFIGLVIALLGIFSSYITESVRFSLNRADLRTQKYEEMAKEVSKYIFLTETLTDFLENNMMTRKSYELTEKAYNDAISTLREKELVYLAWINRYWGKEQSQEFEDFINSTQDFELELHKLNQEENLFSTDPSKKKMDVEKFKSIIISMRAKKEEIKQKGRAILIEMQ